MSFRARIAISAAAAVALTVVAASILLYLVAREQLRGARRRGARSTRRGDLASSRSGILPGQGGKTYLAVRPEFGEARGYVQLVRTDGTVLVPPRQRIKLPVDDDVLAVAGQRGAAFWTDVDVDGEHMRVFTFAYGPDAAVQVARPLTEVDESLRRIGLVSAPDRRRAAS